MSEDDRAAKAARAKALLKKRQQQKKVATSSASATDQPSPPPSRILSPSPASPMPPEDEKRDLADVFGSGNAETHNNNDWLSSLPRAGTPSLVSGTSSTSPPIPEPSSAPPPSQNGSMKDTEALHARISSLEDERNALNQRISELEPLQHALSALDKSLKKEQEEKSSLRSRIAESTSTSQKDKAALDGLRKKVAFLESDNASVVQQLKKLGEIDQKYQETESRLAREKAETASLKDQFSLLNSNLTVLSEDKARLEPFEKHYNDTKAALESEQARLRDIEEEMELFKSASESALQNEQQTIALLVSEKSSLSAEIARLQDAEDDLRANTGLLDQERQRTSALTVDLNRLQHDHDEAITSLSTTTLELQTVSDKSRDQERQLQLATASANEWKEAAGRHKSRVKELEEHIQTDDRADKLEGSLKNTQDRADELEFQLSKLKQTFASLKTERDTLESQSKAHQDSLQEWQMKHTDLDRQVISLREQLVAVQTEKAEALKDKEMLVKAHEQGASSSDKAVASLKLTIAELETKLANSSVEIASTAKQFASAQLEVTNAIRRADDAERLQTELQSEGSNLMQSLNEMRPKIVELTGQKLELTEKVDELEKLIRTHEGSSSALEAALDYLKAENQELAHKVDLADNDRERERNTAEQDSSQLQIAYKELQREFEAASTDVRKLEADRLASTQEAARSLDELEVLTATSRSQEVELVSLRQHIEEIQAVQDEGKGFLERAQEEVEILRLELAAKNEELERRREDTPSESVPTASRSLDDEMLGSLRQQHAIDLSSAQSSIRALESSVFDAEARAHALQKQVHLLEDKLSNIGDGRPFTPPPVPSRPSSRGHLHRHVSSVSSRPSSNLATAPPIAAREILDQNMSPATRHKRKASLAMLQARMESEGRPVKRGILQSVSQGEADGGGDISQHTSYRPQFLDESAIFWCSCCQGDLVQL